MTGDAVVVVCPWLRENELCLKEEQKKKGKKDAESVTPERGGSSPDPACFSPCPGDAACSFFLEFH